MSDDEKLIGGFEFAEAVGSVVRSASPEQRAELSRVIDGFHRDFPDEFHFMTGHGAPVVLYELVWQIIAAVDEDDEPPGRKRRGHVLRLVPKDDATGSVSDNT